MNNELTTTVFGIANCDTVKKTLALLAAQGHAHAFYDYKKRGLPPQLLAQWVEALGWEALVNKRGNTWRAMGASAQAAVTDEASAQLAMQANTSLIKRPIIAWADGRLTVGRVD